jgi:hypothetical protein
LLTLTDDKCINAPAFAERATVAYHPPAKNHLRPPRLHRQTHRRGDKATRVTSPRLTAGQWIVGTDANHAIVAAAYKGAACKNILKRRSAINADLQHSAVKAGLQVEVIAEGYLHRLGSFAEKNAW